MTGPARPGPPPGARPGPPPGPRPGPPPGAPRPAVIDDTGEARHPAVDAAVQAMANAAGLPPADQIAQYEAAYETLRETLATIDQA
ncbi:hypothetical protein Q3W71_21900 [Micromonospora sp. C28SCA-DRY-2]|uniref:hypothetical protein n=1 Tax=Micromonospora sp. C28SCA-DRY-2 TaxID=3059522 RepID=UPI0026768D67|nr:hypothetical protein [Micromonospora sp. C28SCA-DRY-2]MDO3704320.1 hypothetical protein [Micromonospora sp. C28SCA-DRY-2]